MRNLLFIFFFLFSLHSQARVLRVGPAQKYKSIRSAVLASSAGDTILVEPGMYIEKNITINKPITLTGLQFPVLDGEHQYEILSLKSDHITVSGFKIIHSGVSSMDDIAGIKIYNSREVTVTNNILEDDFFGIYVQAGIKCRIENNDIKAHATSEQQSGNGIHCWKCDSLTIRKNNVSGHRDGIYFEFVTNSIIEFNVSARNLRYGLHFMFSHHDDYVSNTFKNNGAGVSVMFTHGVKMLNNRFEDNWGDGSFGLLLKEISDSYISGNTFCNNTAGIYMEGASRIQIEGNLFQHNGWAMKIQASCMDVHVTRNNFLSNTFDIATNGVLVLNTFNHNYWDKYEGYDLNKDHVGDIAFHPVSLFSMIVEKNPSAMMLFRSFMTTLLDKTEKIVPSLTPENLKDDFPFYETHPVMIIASNVSKKFGQLKALDNVSATCNRGECIALIGPNGSGKTTLIKSILGMVMPNSGFITFNGKNILHDWIYRDQIGYMPQTGRYPENMSIRQVISMMKDIRQKAGSKRLDEELLQSFGLDKILDKRMRTLSGGTRQKVSATLAFLFNPDVLILDEPTAGLDPVASEILKAKIVQEKQKGKLILVTSHILSDLDDLITQVIYMHEGKLIFHKSLANLKTDTGEIKLSKAIASVMSKNRYYE